MSLIAELRRRNVFRMAAGYIAASWLLVQVVETLLPVFGFGDAAVRYTVIALVVGFIPALAVSWAFEWTPEGLVRDTDSPVDSPVRMRAVKTWDRVVLVVLALAVGLFAFERFVITPEREAALVEAATEAGIEIGRGGTADIPDESVAVLPFVNMSANQENEYFSDGLTDTLLHMLAQLNDLKVAARTSSFAFKDKNEDIRAIGDALSVAHILEGSVQRAEDRVRVTAQLIRAADGYHVWSQNYDRSLTNIFAIQDEIAAAVAIALGSSLLSADSGALSSVATTDIIAYDYYLRGINAMLISTDRSLLDAKRLLNLALETDPGFTEARLALIQNVMRQQGKLQIERAEGMAEAERLVAEVLTDDSENLAARQFKAVLNFMRVTWEEMDMTSMDTLVDEMLPLFQEGEGSAFARTYAASFLADLGRHHEGYELIEQAIVTDPLNVDLLTAQSNVLRQLGRYEEARVPLLTQLEIEPGNAMVYWRLGNLERAQGHFAEALPYLKQHALMDEMAPLPAFILGMLMDNAGLYVEADRWHAIFDERNPDESFTIGRDLYRAIARGDKGELRNVVTDGMDRLLKGETDNRYFGPLSRYYAVVAHEDGTSREALEHVESYYPGISDFTSFKGPDWLVFRLQAYGVLPLLLDLNDDDGDARILRDARTNTESYGVNTEDFDGWHLEFEYLEHGHDAGKAVFMERYADTVNIFDPDWVLHIETPWLAGLRADPEVAAVIAAREARIAEIREEMRAVIERPEWREETF